MGKEKLDVGAMSDAELSGLIDEMRQESNRRNKLGNTNASLLKSRWLVSLLLLCVAFFILFKAERSTVNDDSKNQASQSMAKPGQKGAWALEPEKKNDEIIGEEEIIIEEEPEVIVEEEEPEPAPAPATEAPAKEEKQTPAQVDTPPSNSIYKDFPLNLASDEAKKAAFAEGTRPKVRYQYNRRSTLTDKAEQEKLAKQWGSWTVTDPKASERPTHDFAKDFPNRDIPWDKFPANAWQVDQEYLAKFLPEARALVERALEAMLAEYGWSKFDMPDKSFEERVEGGSFKIEYLNVTGDGIDAGRKSFKGDLLGGWVAHEYFDGLVRRLMHALLTDDTFTLVMGGHSASAGHGNHFVQSYTMQFFKVLEPIFARLGLKLRATNNGYGGLGTAQSALAGGDMYGREIDILVWDSQMTEPSAPAYDLFVRQVFMSGNRIPVLMGGFIHTIKWLYKTVTPEVGMFGAGTAGVPEVTDHQQAESIIWAARYLNCNSEMHSHCRAMEYNGTCWIERDDYTPVTPQKKEPSGRASWHPGFKQHAIKGRIIAFTVLRALLEGLKQWDEAPGKKLPEEVWHVADHYKNIRTRLEAVPHEGEEAGYCVQYQSLPFKQFCHTPFNAVGEMTPRAFPRETAVRNLMHPAYDGYLPVPMENEYNPPDVLNPCIELPEGEFDYMAVVENGVEFRELLTFDNSPLPAGTVHASKKVDLGIKDIKPGLGWSADANANPDECDGSYDGFCGRGIDKDCLLYGHHDHRGGLQFDSYSGWGVFTVPKVKLGIILVRMEWWHPAADNHRTIEWTEENNGDPAYNSRHLSATTGNVTKVQPSRRLGRPVRQTERMLAGGEELCDNFKIEFAVDGQITTLNKEQFKEKAIHVQRVVQLHTIMNNTERLGGYTLDVDFAVRMTGCEKKNMFKLSHIYWA